MRTEICETRIYNLLAVFPARRSVCHVPGRGVVPVPGMRNAYMLRTIHRTKVLENAVAMVELEPDRFLFNYIDPNTEKCVFSTAGVQLFRNS